MNRKHLLSFLLLLLVGPALSQAVAPAAVQLTHLRCELLTSPEVIDATAPRLSWELSSAGRGLEQTAYQLLVASTPESWPPTKATGAYLDQLGRIGTEYAKPMGHEPAELARL